MRRTYERCTKARLSFSGGPHAPVNMADSMENAGGWTVSGSKEATDVPKNFKDLRKLGVPNIAQYSHVYRPAKEVKPRSGAISYVLRMIVKLQNISGMFSYHGKYFHTMQLNKI